MNTADIPNDLICETIVKVADRAKEYVIKEITEATGDYRKKLLSLSPHEILFIMLETIRISDLALIDQCKEKGIDLKGRLETYIHQRYEQQSTSE